MALTLVTAPAAEPLIVDELQRWTRITDEAEGVTLEELVAAARQHIDGRDGWLGRALITQTWDLSLDEFPCGSIPVPLPPLQSVTWIRYVDGNGDTQTLSSSAYTLSADRNHRPRIHLAYGQSWPTTRCMPDAVTVRFVAGYGDPADVPEPIRKALAMMVSHWGEHRELIIPGVSVAEVPFGAQQMLAPYRIY